MAIVEVPVRNLHQGVSRQPDNARFMGQLQDAQNVFFRVEEAGFTKRFGTEVVARVEGAPTNTVLPFHVIDIGSSNKYGLTIDNGTILLFDLLTGTQQTVTVALGSAAYVTNTDPTEFAFTTILGYTFIVNRSVTVAITADVSPVNVNAAVFQIKDGRAGTYTIHVDGHNAQHIPDQTQPNTYATSFIVQQLTSALTGALGASYNVVQKNSTILVYRNDNAVMTVSAEDPAGGQGIVITDTQTPIASTDMLPSIAVDGMIVTIGATSGSTVSGTPATPSFYIKFTATDGNQGYWAETIKPGIAYKFDPATMPHTLIYNGGTSWSFGPATWDNRVTGDTLTVPNPDFVGNTINDVTVFRNRLALLTGEFIWYSATGEFFRFWPKFSTQDLDNDPFGDRGSSGRVNIQRFAVPFRKVLFSTSDEFQFESSAQGVLTSKTGAMDQSTSYLASEIVRPVPMGQMLYFPSFNLKNAIILEYSYDFYGVTAMAQDVTKHVRGYIPQNIVGLAKDPPTGNLWVLSDSDRSKLYNWTVFWKNDQPTLGQREQSSWSQWYLPAASIHNVAVNAGYLYLLTTRGTDTWIEKLPLSEGDHSNFVTDPRLDLKKVITGTFDGTNTTYTLPYAAALVTAVLPDGTLPSIVGTSGDNITLAGNPGQCSFGFTFASFVTLSKQYHRDQQGTPMINGVLNLSQFTVSHKSTGYYELHVDAPGRATEVHTYNAVLDTENPETISGQISTMGTFHGAITANGVKSTISIHNDTHLPFTVNEIVFRGVFNETVRQG